MGFTSQESLNRKDRVLKLNGKFGEHSGNDSSVNTLKHSNFEFFFYTGGVTCEKKEKEREKMRNFYTVLEF